MVLIGVIIGSYIVGTIAYIWLGNLLRFKLVPYMPAVVAACLGSAFAGFASWAALIDLSLREWLTFAALPFTIAAGLYIVHQRSIAQSREIAEVGDDEV
jgi:uncharacterized membrane protein YfcA